MEDYSENEYDDYDEYDEYDTYNDIDTTYDDDSSDYENEDVEDEVIAYKVARKIARELHED
jgi:hypothetical protein